MNTALLNQKLPEVKAWIDRALAEHRHQARSIASLGLSRLDSFYSPTLLTSSKFIAIAEVPVPPLAKMGLPGFSEFEQLDAAGITYLDTYFIRTTEIQNESLHFHELVHVIQWQHLGPDRFIMAYALGHLIGGGYYKNPLEIMAYDLQAQFDNRYSPFDVEAQVRSRLDAVCETLFKAVR
ncbi:MAG TPA: hypothetical protein VKC60_08860 [Opitutaceae bacterium]|nr:hypothetical protein [Opitutaceae bacterium]